MSAWYKSLLVFKYFYLPESLKVKVTEVPQHKNQFHFIKFSYYEYVVFLQNLSSVQGRSPRPSRPRRYASASPGRRSDQPRKTLTFTWTAKTVLWKCYLLCSGVRSNFSQDWSQCTVLYVAPPLVFSETKPDASTRNYSFRLSWKLDFEDLYS